MDNTYCELRNAMRVLDDHDGHDHHHNMDNDGHSNGMHHEQLHQLQNMVHEDISHMQMEEPPSLLHVSSHSPQTHSHSQRLDRRLSGDSGDRLSELKTITLRHNMIEQDDLDEHAGPSGTQVLQEQDRFLPIANITRVMRRTIPANGKMAKDAKELVQECTSEFISFITSEANDRCLSEKRKTLTPDDLIDAMEQLGFDSYVEPLRNFLRKYREYNNRMKPNTNETPHSRIVAQHVTNAENIAAMAGASHTIFPHHRLDNGHHSNGVQSVQNGRQPMNTLRSPPPNHTQFIREQQKHDIPIMHNHSQQQSSYIATSELKRPEADKHDVVIGQTDEQHTAEVDLSELQPSGIQIMVDPSTMQYYITQPGEDGSVTLMPITLEQNMITMTAEEASAEAADGTVVMQDVAMPHMQQHLAAHAQQQNGGPIACGKPNEHFTMTTTSVEYLQQNNGAQYSQAAIRVNEQTPVSSNIMDSSHGLSGGHPSDIHPVQTKRAVTQGKGLRSPEVKRTRKIESAGKGRHG